MTYFLVEKQILTDLELYLGTISRTFEDRP